MQIDTDRHLNALDSHSPAPAAAVNLDQLKSLCPSVRFAPGDVLRRAGQHCTEMYVLTDGWVDVELATGKVTLGPRERGAGSPIGEIGYLLGWPATATVTARTSVGAVMIDDAVLARLETEHPVLTAQLLRHVAQVADERTGEGLTFISTPSAYTNALSLEVRLCRTGEMLETAQRLRYEVYCGELSRTSPYADHNRKIISDDLDKTGHTFVAVETGEIVGTLRLNMTTEGPLGVLEELYGMTASPHHPRATSICTKFIVKKSWRRSPAAIALISAVGRFGVGHDLKECYIDCVPALLPYYKAMGFKVTAPPFLHRENGTSHPMKVDLVKHGERLSSDTKARFLALYLKAKAIKWIDGLRGDGSAPARR